MVDFIQVALGLYKLGVLRGVEIDVTFCQHALTFSFYRQAKTLSAYARSFARPIANSQMILQRLPLVHTCRHHLL